MTCPNIVFVPVLLPTAVIVSQPLHPLSCSVSSVLLLCRDGAQRVVTKCEILIRMLKVNYYIMWVTT